MEPSDDMLEWQEKERRREVEARRKSYEEGLAEVLRSVCGPPAVVCPPVKRKRKRTSAEDAIGLRDDIRYLENTIDERTTRAQRLETSRILRILAHYYDHSKPWDVVLNPAEHCSGLIDDHEDSERAKLECLRAEIEAIPRLQRVELRAVFNDVRTMVRWHDVSCRISSVISYPALLARQLRQRLDALPCTFV